MGLNVRRVALLLLFFVVLTGMAAASAPVMFRFDAARTGDYSTVAGPPSNGKLLWKIYTGSAISPVVADGIVYTGPSAITADTGEILWTNPDVYGYPAVADGIVYVAGYGRGSYSQYDPTEDAARGASGQLYALNAATGAVIWNSTSIDPYKEYDMYHHIGGPLLWQRWDPEYFVSSPVVADGHVYLMDNRGFLYKFSASSGTREGKVDTGNSWLDWYNLGGGLIRS